MTRRILPGSERIPAVCSVGRLLCDDAIAGTSEMCEEFPGDPGVVVVRNVGRILDQDQLDEGRVMVTP